MEPGQLDMSGINAAIDKLRAESGLYREAESIGLLGLQTEMIRQETTPTTDYYDSRTDVCEAIRLLLMDEPPINRVISLLEDVLWTKPMTAARDLLFVAGVMILSGYEALALICGLAAIVALLSALTFTVEPDPEEL